MKVPVVCVRVADTMPWMPVDSDGEEQGRCELCTSDVLVAAGVGKLSELGAKVMLICTRCLWTKLQAARGG